MPSRPDISGARAVAAAATLVVLLSPPVGGAAPATVTLPLDRRPVTPGAVLEDFSLSGRIDWEACPPGWIPTSTGEVRSYQATVDGVPILDATLRVYRRRDGRLAWAVLPSAVAGGSLCGPRRTPGSADPWLLSDDAVRRAGRRHLDARARQVGRTWLLAEGGLIPAYALLHTGERPQDEQLLLLDARQGGLLERRRLGRPASGAGWVFDPNPVVTAGDRSLTDGDDVDPWRVRVELRDLAGDGMLRGLWAAVGSPAAEAFDLNHQFFFSSRNPHFEEVMAYYHVTEAQRHVQALGFSAMCAEPQAIVVHATTADYSWYSSVARTIYLGDGGADDGEDADIILHEYGHALFTAAVGGMGSADSRALSEGVADYFAATLTGDPCIGDWDAAHFHSGCLRDIGEARLYPADLTGEPHADGQIWASLLWELRRAAAAPETDRLALETLYFLTPLSTLEDAGCALLTAAGEIERMGGSPGLADRAAEILARWGLGARQGSRLIAAGDAQHSLPLGFSFRGPGCAPEASCDSVRIAADGSLLLLPVDPAGGQPMLAPVMAQPAAGGGWSHDSLEIAWEGTLQSFMVDLRFRRAGSILRHTAARLTAAGEIEVSWFGEGDQMAFPCVVGWLPAGSAGPLARMDLSAEREWAPAAGEGLAADLPAQPFPLAGGVWRMSPRGESGYLAVLARLPIPRDPLGGQPLFLFPSPARIDGRIAFRLTSSGDYRITLCDPAGRHLARRDLTAMPAGLHEIGVSSLAPETGSLPAGMYFLHLTGAAQSRVGRLLLIR